MTKEENEAGLEKLKQIVRALPEKPGSYQYYDKEGNETTEENTIEPPPEVEKPTEVEE